MTEPSGTAHWDEAYAKGATSRSWYQPEATESLAFIASTGSSAADSVVDIGGGASTLVDGLIARGYDDLTVLDLSSEGMAVARERLGAAGSTVSWVTADVLRWEPARTFDLWHDRAVLHFLTDDDDRAAYAAKAAELVVPSGWVTIGGFAPDGPTSCSGLPVRGASSEELARLLAPHFAPRHSAGVVHTTPSGNDQAFAWLVAQRV